MRPSSLSAAALVAGLSAAMSGSAMVLQRTDYEFGKAPTLRPPKPRDSAYRKGRRTWAKALAIPGGNPAGSKLAKQALKGVIGINRIR